MTYTPDQVRALTPYRRTIESRGPLPELRDLFLCHAWDDRRGVATELNDLLEAKGVPVWFSEKDILLGQPFMREIDRGLAKSRAGLVLITPALLERVNNRGVSDKELSELLARDQLIPVVHGTTYDEVRKVSPLLGSRHGLDTAEDSMEVIATKIAELVHVEDLAGVGRERSDPVA
ncbi:MAG TPA: toll/interleukin-1 receptor domain-containing protein [Acidimicrobiales bacterium]|nr:toll/interleukin-1 receptor domain-containing protein [Acidimicrobiales bacterium]